MQRLPSFVSLVLVRLVRALRSLQWSPSASAPRPTFALVPIPVGVERRRLETLHRYDFLEADREFVGRLSRRELVLGAVTRDE